MVTWPVIFRLWIIKSNSRIQSTSELSQTAALHSILKVQKSGLEGPRMILPKIKSLARKARIANMKIAISDLMICHLNSSRWSKKDISFSGLLSSWLTAYYFEKSDTPPSIHSPHVLHH